MIMNELQGKIALVTGGSRGIGRAIAVALAEAGADVAVNYLTREQAAKEVCSQIEQRGHRGITARADVSIAAEVTRLVETVGKQLGAVSILVNNAGIIRPQPIDKITEKDWDDLITANLKSVFLVTQAVLPKMRTARWGRIINISSGAAQVGGVVGPHYAASKAGMLGLTRSYASILVKEGITVNAVAPALIHTDMTGNNAEAFAKMIPAGRLGTAEEVAEAVVMLARNGYMTGQTLHLNGGLYMS